MLHRGAEVDALEGVAGLVVLEEDVGGGELDGCGGGGLEEGSEGGDYGGVGGGGGGEVFGVQAQGFYGGGGMGRVRLVLFFFC